MAQFAGTSLWFAGNAVLPELKQALGLNQYAISLVTSAVMLGFVAGTLVFAVLMLADRISPVKLFFYCSLLGAAANAAVIVLAKGGLSLFILRFLTGFFIAGIYPVGMKIASDWYEKGLGKALGFLLGALVLGTAFPHLLKNRDFDIAWKAVIVYTSVAALAGGILMLSFVGDGPYRKTGGRFRWNAVAAIFDSRRWRQAAFGYFGHMWELYTFWGFLPLLLELYNRKHGVLLNIPLLSFFIIASGAASCIAGGYLSNKWGSARVAFSALLISGCCCLLVPLFFMLPGFLFVGMLIIWGLSVAPDSPQFSALVAQYAPADLRGTALTIYNSIGFTIAAVSLLVTDRLIYMVQTANQHYVFVLLGLGAMVGLPFIARLIQKNKPMGTSGQA